PLHPLVDKPLRLCLCAIVAGDGVAFLQEAVRHLAAHGAETDVSNICHLFHPDRLDIGKFPRPMNSQFTAVAGEFYTAERHSRVGNHHFIDKNHAGFDLVFELIALPGIVGPGTCAETETGVVRNPDGFVDVLHAKDGSDWAAEISTVGWRLRWDVG